MTCLQFTSYLHEYLFEPMSEAEKRRFERHLSKCPACVDYLASYRATLALEEGYKSNTAEKAVIEAPQELIDIVIKRLSLRKDSE